VATAHLLRWETIGWLAGEILSERPQRSRIWGINQTPPQRQRQRTRERASEREREREELCQVA